MADSSQLHEKANSYQRTSFILRCWPGASGQVRARLINVHTKQTYPVASLADLPALIERLLSALDSVPNQQKPVEGGDVTSSF